MIYKKHVSEPWFTLIKRGEKIVEGRLNKGEFSQMKKGDIIEWLNNELNKNGTKKRPFKTKIIDIKRYKTFEEYLKMERLKNTLPGINRINNGLKIYYKYYTKEDEKKYGILGIKIEVI